MELGEQGHNMNKLQIHDYWAEAQLGRVDTLDPLISAYDGQDAARLVGFDFKGIPEMLPRALDEVRETREAFDDFLKAQSAEEEADTLEHLGDEIADLVFSGVNLARHRNRTPYHFPALES